MEIMKNTMLPFLFLAQITLMFLAVRGAVRAAKLSRDQARPLYTVIAFLAPAFETPCSTRAAAAARLTDAWRTRFWLPAAC